MIEKPSSITQLIGWLSKEKDFVMLKKQLQKDTDMMGFDLDIISIDTPSDLVDELYVFFSDELTYKTNQVYGLLYRIDICEDDLKKLQTMDIDKKIPFLVFSILQLEWHKVQFRKIYNDNDGIDILNL